MQLVQRDDIMMAPVLDAGAETAAAGLPEGNLSNQGALVGILTEADFVRYVADAPAGVARADVSHPKQGASRP